MHHGSHAMCPQCSDVRRMDGASPIRCASLWLARPTDRTGSSLSAQLYIVIIIRAGPGAQIKPVHESALQTACVSPSACVHLVARRGAEELMPRQRNVDMTCTAPQGAPTPHKVPHPRLERGVSQTTVEPQAADRSIEGLQNCRASRVPRCGHSPSHWHFSLTRTWPRRCRRRGPGAGR